MAVETRELIPIGEAALRMGVSIDTVRRWEREGRIIATRTLGGQRRFRIADIERLRKASEAAASEAAS